MKKKFFQLRKTTAQVRKILFLFVFFFSFSPLVIPYADVATTVFQNIINNSEKLLQIGSLLWGVVIVRYTNQQDPREIALKFQEQKENTQTPIAAPGANSTPITGLREAVTKVTPGWEPIFKQNSIFADAFHQQYSYSIQQSLFEAARHSVHNYTREYNVPHIQRMLAREQELERQKYEYARNQEIEHQLRLQQDSQYRSHYEFLKEHAITLTEQLTYGSAADRLSAIKILFYNHKGKPYKNQLFGYDYYALNMLLNDLKDIFIDRDIPREQIGNTDIERSQKFFEQFKLRLERNSKEYIYICPAKFNVTREDALVGFITGFIERCERANPEQTRGWLTTIDQQTDHLSPFERLKKEQVTQHRTLFDHIQQAFKISWQQKYTNDGFARVGCPDPLLKSLNKEERKKISSDSKALYAFNTILLARSQRIEDLRETIGVSEYTDRATTRTCTDILYGLINQEINGATPCQQINYLVDHVTPDTLSYFFNPSGITKLTSINPAVSGIHGLRTVTTQLHRDILKRLNYLAALDAKQLQQKYLDQLQKTLTKAFKASSEEEAHAHLAQFDLLFPSVSSPHITAAELEGIFAQAEQLLQRKQKIAQPVLEEHAITWGPEQQDPKKEKKKEQEQLKLEEIHPEVRDLKKLQRAYDLFKDTPGAMGDGPLGRILRCGTKTAVKEGTLGTARGAMYELEKALDLIDQGEKILRFSMNEGGLEFDIITKNFWAECKAYDWEKISKKTMDTLQSKLPSQARIARMNGTKFHLYSRQAIPEWLRKWLLEKEITFFEDNNVT